MRCFLKRIFAVAFSMFWMFGSEHKRSHTRDTRRHEWIEIIHSSRVWKNRKSVINTTRKIFFTSQSNLKVLRHTRRHDTMPLWESSERKIINKSHQQWKVRKNYVRGWRVERWIVDFVQNDFITFRTLDALGSVAVKDEMRNEMKSLNLIIVRNTRSLMNSRVSRWEYESM